MPQRKLRLAPDDTKLEESKCIVVILSLMNVGNAFTVLLHFGPKNPTLHLKFNLLLVHSFVIFARIQECRGRNERKGRGADLHPSWVHFPRPEQPSSHRPTNTSSNAHVIKPLPLSCRHRKRVCDFIARRGRGRVMCCQL